MTPHEKLESLSRKLAHRLRLHLPREAVRLRWCSHPLNHPDREAQYCHSPYCGMCQRLKAEEESKLLRDHLQMLKEWKPTTSFYHFCATAPDCQPGEIRETLTALKAGWSRLIRKDVFKRHCVGWFLTFEVVASKRDRTLENAHVHAVMIMAPSYSGRYYLNTEDWQQLWQECVCLLYTSPSPRDGLLSRMPSSA